MGAYVSVRHPARHPHYSLLLTLADEVHDPCLLGIRDGEGLAFGRVAVAVRQLHDSADGLARGAGTLQGHVDQRTIVHHTVLVYLLFASAPCGLGYYELVLVHVAHGLEGLRHLRDLPCRAVGVPFGDREHRASLPFGCRVEVELAVEHVRVGGVGDYGGAVGAGSAGDDYIGAGVSRDAGNQGCADGNGQKLFHFLRIILIFVRF